jgi:aspartate/methionine/tyrosine aminotransferase/acyl-coenzyme A synthetase/AMP-(fatty) acid ligase
MDTIGKINTLNETLKDKVFLIDAKSGKELTFSALYAESCKLAEVLKELGLNKGDKIVFSLENSVEFVKLYFACLYSGLVSVPLNPVLSASQKDYIITHSAAKMVVFSDSTMQGFSKETLDSNATLNLKLTNDILSDLNNTKSIDLNKLSAKGNFKAFQDYTENDELIIVYTSGTTSNPKGVIHTLKSIVENATEFCDLLNISGGNRFYNNLSMTYLGGYYNLMLLPFCAGASVVLNDVFDARSIVSFWDPVITYKVNTFWIVPTVVSILNDFDRGDKGIGYCKTNIKLVLTGTAPLYESVREKFEKKYSLRLIENYALSETLFISSDRINEDRVSKSVGKILPQKEVKIMNNANEELPFGEEGEIVVKTSTLMKGYFNVEDPSLNIDKSSPWFYSGDIGFKDADNNLYVTGRKKDLIIRGGINISPKAIEDVVSEVTGVLECAVVGLPNKLTGEDIVAVIKIDEGYTIADLSKQVMAACTQKLSSIQLPSMVIELADFPKTSSNKIQKNKIKTWVEEKMKATAKPARSEAKQNNPNFFKVSTVVGNSIQAVSIRYNNLVYEMQKKGIDVTVLSLGEAFFDIPLFPFDDLPMPAIYHYTHSRGIPELRENLNTYFKEHFEFGFDPEKEIVVTAGSKIAIHMVMMALINPGDEVIIHEPAWVSYPEQIKLCYGVPVQIPYDEDVFNFEKYITNRTKLIIINSPNNPSGKLFTIEELSHLNKLAKKYNLFILSDEAYSDFTLKSDPFISLGNLDTTFSHSIVVNSISKNYGISGWRLGYIITNEALTDQILKLNQHLITCPPTILQYYIAKHFAEIIKITKPQILSVVEKRNEVKEYLNSVGLTALDGKATFYLFVSIAPTKLGSEEFCTRLLNEKHICIVPGIGYGKSCDAFVRLSIGTESMERIKAGINEIKKLIDETK